MKIRITSLNYKIGTIKRILVAFLMLFSMSFFAQEEEGEYDTYFVVTSVAPTRVTLQSRVIITAAAGTIPPKDELTAVACKNIYKDRTGLKVNANRTQVSFTIERVTGFPLDQNEREPLKMSSTQHGQILKDVYVGSYLPVNQVFLEYVLPTPKTLSNAPSDMTKITEIFTTFNGFWRSSEWKNNPTDPAKTPNTSHDLLGFTYDGVIYSTGVHDALLTTNLSPSEVSTINYQTFKAYSTNGVSGNTASDNYLAMADMIDGEVNETVLSPSIANTSIYNVLIDGVNGLDLGTGITNFSKTTNVSFYSGKGNVGAVDDEIPDLLLTQIAEPSRADVYYYSDHLGNVVGRPVSLLISNEKTNGSAILAEWSLDFFNMSRTTYDLSVPTSGVEITSRKRPLRMAAFKLNEFEITAVNIDSVNNIKMAAGGGADLAFIAYNRAAFDIKSPLVTKAPISRFICKFPSSTTIKFNAEVEIDGGSSSSTVPEEEKLKYRWFKNQTLIPSDNTNEYTIPFSPITSDQLATYKLEVSNEKGTVILPVTLSQGGVPAVWNGMTFDLPPAYIAGGFTVVDSDRSLIFSREEPYNVAEDLEGCDCLVPAGSTVTIKTGKTLKLYNNIVVEGETDIRDENGDLIGEFISAGTFTLENNASLIQTKPLPFNENENSGNIIVKREAENLKKDDYVYWSSPVADFDVNNILGSRRYIWDLDIPNVNETTGNWANASGIMTAGKGYIVRVPSTISPSVTELTNIFDGIPNNGDYIIPIKMSPDYDPEKDHGNMNWNLIGNPYPSAINVEKFLSLNIHVKKVDNGDVNEPGYIEGGVYIWTHETKFDRGGSSPFYEDFGYNYNADDYKTANALASTEPEFKGNIASGQGFFVKAVSDGLVTFKNAMRFDGSAPNYGNDQFYRSSNNSESAQVSDSEKQLLWLALSNDSKAATIAVIGYAKGATYGEDALYDATTMGDGDFSLYSNVANKRMAIQGRPLPFDNQDKVTLGVAVPKNGIYNIGIDHLKGSLMLNDDQGIYLEDTYNNVIHDLKNAPYGFTATAGNVKDRFVLRYTDQQLSVEDHLLSDTFVYINNEQLYVKASKNIESVVIYDLTGKKLMDYKLEGYSDAFNTQFQFSRGAYLTVIKLENSGIITKKVMN